MITIDATVGGANSNSYVTLAEASAYFETRLYTTNWTNADDEDKKKALVQSTRRLDYEKFYGNRKTSTQALSFPRTGLGTLDGVELDDIISRQIKEATYELAIYMLDNDMSQPSVDDSNVKRKKEKVGSLEVETEYHFDSGDNVSVMNDTLPPFVESLLDGIARNVSTSGMITVSR